MPPPVRRPGEPLPPPTRSSPTADGSQGCGPDAPKLTPAYLAKWNVIAKSRIGGSYEYDNTANCLPPGVPAMMSAAYGMEVMQDAQKITFFSEHLDALRRVYLDGRKPSAQVLADPTYAGYSTGRWEGDTLVVDTVALSDKSFIDGSSPHSAKMTVHERLRMTEPGPLARFAGIHPIGEHGTTTATETSKTTLASGSWRSIGRRYDLVTSFDRRWQGNAG